MALFFLFLAYVFQWSEEPGYPLRLDRKPFTSTPDRNREEDRSPKVAVWTPGVVETEGGLHARHIS